MKLESIEKELLQSCSNGDITNVINLLDSNPALNLDCEDSTQKFTPLIYAACFGHSVIAKILLQNKLIDVNKTDNRACNNHQETVQVLVDAGANTADKKLHHIIKFAKDKSISKRMSAIFDLAPSPPDNLLSMFEDDKTAVNENHSNYSESTFTSSEEEEEDEERSFEWEKCLYDQMFVFSPAQIENILSVALERTGPSTLVFFKKDTGRFAGANLLFLCIRYAHYYNSAELVAEFFKRSIHRITIEVKKKNELNHTFYWIRQTQQILYYLKKDPNLLIATFDFQMELTELLQDLLCFVVVISQNRILQVLDSAFLTNTSIEESTTQIQFESILDGIKRKGGFLNLFQQKQKISKPEFNSSVNSKEPYQVSNPKTILSILDSLKISLQTFKINKSYKTQIFQKLFEFIGAEMFNRILSLHCSRNKGVTIRMNLSLIEEWIKLNPDVDSTSKDLQPDHHSIFPPLHNTQSTTLLQKTLLPSIHLTQLLQVITSLQDLPDFLEIFSTTVLRLKSVCLIFSKYRYEIGEIDIAGEIKNYVFGVVKEIKTVPEQSEFLEVSLVYHEFKIGKSGGEENGVGVPFIEEDLFEFLDF